MDNMRWPSYSRHSTYDCQEQTSYLRRGLCRRSARAQEQKSLLKYLFLLTGFFILLECSFFIQCYHAYLYTFQFVANKISIPYSVLPGIIGFIFAQLLIHAGFCLLIWYTVCSLACLFKIPTNKMFMVGISIFFLAISTILAANCYLFPNAKFSELIRVILNPSAAQILTYLLGGACLSLFMLAIINSFLKRRYIWLLSWCLLSAIYFYPSSFHGGSAATTTKPNIFIIGIDSVRPDYLGYSGHSIKTNFIDSVLQQSTVFNDAYTPLARTFPAWTAILTGMYPKQTGMRTDLAEHKQPYLAESLANILKQQGYETLYASDETRFSNIDEYFGFEQTITPPIGLNDFLLGTFNDFPLSNLVVNTKIGKWLFPYSYGNRPAYFTYNPDSFLDLIKPSIFNNHTRPLFFAIHFCLPHHTYLWQQLSGMEYKDEIPRYELSIQRTDQQLADFFAMLEQAKLLDHAIVVLLSDHGEAFELPGDRITDKARYVEGRTKIIPRFYPPSLDEEEFNQSAGHGTDVLGLTQYHSLLAIRLYGLNQQQYKGSISGNVSLAQIKPTILSLLKDNKNGLAPYILGLHQQVANQHIFLESDFSPAAVRSVHPEIRQVVLDGIELFRIDPLNTRLIVKPEMEKMILESKQFADFYGDWMLAVYPQSNNVQIPILVNVKTGQWTDNLQSTFAKKSPVSEMLLAMKAFYGKDLKNNFGPVS